LREMAVQSEVTWYAEIARADYPDEYQLAMDTYGNTPRGRQCAAEYAYYMLHDALPEWGTIIERVETINDGHIFIHRDMTALT